MIKDLLENLKVNILKIVNEMGASDVEVVFEVPKDEAHGDYSTNIAMRLAKVLRKAPMVIANDIISKIDLKENHLDNTQLLQDSFHQDKVYVVYLVYFYVIDCLMGRIRNLRKVVLLLIVAPAIVKGALLYTPP